MQEKSFRLPEPESMAVRAADVDKLINAAEPVMALVYLYILRYREVAPAQISRALNMDVKEAETVCARLEQMGLLRADKAGTAGAQSVPMREDAPPEYTAKEIRERTGSDPDFTALVQELQKLLGRVLSAGDLTILFGIYDYLGMPAEVILHLANYCAERCEKRYGQGRKPTMRAIEKEAYLWSKKGIESLELAEQYLRWLAELEQDSEQVKLVLGIHGRKLVSAEEKYIRSWLEMGFDAGAIGVAYERTVLKTGGMSWPYMNSILKSWHEKGLHSEEEVKTEKNIAFQKKNPAERDTERMRRYLERLKRE